MVRTPHEPTPLTRHPALGHPPHTHTRTSGSELRKHQLLARWEPRAQTPAQPSSSACTWLPEEKWSSPAPQHRPLSLNVFFQRQSESDSFFSSEFSRKESPFSWLLSPLWKPGSSLPFLVEPSAIYSFQASVTQTVPSSCIYCAHKPLLRLGKSEPVNWLCKADGCNSYTVPASDGNV